MSDLRSKLTDRIPWLWDKVGNLPPVPDDLREPLTELVQAMGVFKEVSLQLFEMVSKRNKTSARETLIAAAQADAYLHAWGALLEIPDDELPWWEAGKPHYADTHPLS